MHEGTMDAIETGLFIRPELTVDSLMQACSQNRSRSGAVAKWFVRFDGLRGGFRSQSRPITLCPLVAVSACCSTNEAPLLGTDQGRDHMISVSR